MSIARTGGLVAAVPLILMSAAAGGATYYTTKKADTLDGSCDADCSLREAIQAANVNPGPDVVYLMTHHHISRNGPGDEDDNAYGDFDISDDLQLRAPAFRNIDGNDVDRVLEIMPGVTVEIVGLVVKDGGTSGRGGGIYNAGDLTLRRMYVVYHSLGEDADGVMQGGAIYNEGQLRIVDSIIDQNVAIGGVEQDGGRGGAIYNAHGARLWIYDSNLRDNMTGLDDVFGWGAGIYNAGNARIERCFFGANDAGDGDGAAIANRHGGTVVLVNSTISNNGHDSASAAVANGASHDLQPADEPQSSLSLVNVTIANNNGGGLLNTGQVTMRNTLIAGNYTQDGNDRWYESSSNCRNEGQGRITQSSTLLGADGSACLADIYVDNRSVFGTVLEHLQYLGGRTPVHRPLPGPYAIDAGASETCPALDQRSAARPTDGDGDGVAVCDIGAMEVDT